MNKIELVHCMKEKNTLTINHHLLLRLINNKTYKLINNNTYKPCQYNIACLVEMRIKC